MELGELWDRSGEDVRLSRVALGVKPVFKMVDTCAAEFEAATPYFYSTYGGTENETVRSTDLTDETDGKRRERVIILGSGPNRIGQGIEFDYANVHAVWALQEEGYEVIMVNSNPETVSTDYDTADRLYFEPLTAEDVLAIIENERPIGVVVTFGGQTPLKLARTLVEHNIPLLGMDYGMIEMAEDRKQFGALLDQLGLKSPPYGTAFTVDEALHVAESLGYPVLLRPSYVLGGRAMEIVANADELRHYITEAARVSAGHPVLIDRFLEDALELDVDILTDGEDVWVAGLMEQIEEAGVHSGDSACVLPPASLSERQIAAVEDAAARLVLAMGAKGLVNLQMAIKGDQLYILEANPRASRTVPFVSKAIGVPLAKLAAKVLVGRKLRDLLASCALRVASSESANRRMSESPSLPLPPSPSPPPSTVYRLPSTPLVSVKEVVLPFRRFPGSDVLLGPEMRSTGEVMSFGAGFPEAFAKSQIAAGNPLPTSGAVLASLTDADKREGIALIAQLHDMGFAILATRGTAHALRAMGIPAEVIHKVGEGRPDCVDVIAQGRVQLVVNTPSVARSEKRILDAPLPASAAERGVPLPWQGARTAGYRIRAAALQYHIPYVTTLVALRTAVAAIRFLRHGTLPVRALGLA